MAACAKSKLKDGYTQANATYTGAQRSSCLLNTYSHTYAAKRLAQRCSIAHLLYDVLVLLLLQLQCGSSTYTTMNKAQYKH
eukprot:6222-Heterococcus_DN1.PRE.5